MLMPNYTRVTRDHGLILVAFARDAAAAPWRPAGLAAACHAGPRYLLRTSPLPEDLDACLSLLAFLNHHAADFKIGAWMNVLRREAVALAEGGRSNRDVTALAVYAAPYVASVDDLFTWHVTDGHVLPYGTAPAPALDVWGDGR